MCRQPVPFLKRETEHNSIEPLSIGRNYEPKTGCQNCQKMVTHDLELQKVSARCRGGSAESAPVKVKTRLLAGKVMANVFWYRFFVSCHDRRTIDALYYCEMLDAAKLAFRWKRKTKSIRSAILLHDNVWLHVANATTQKFDFLAGNFRIFSLPGLVRTCLLVISTILCHKKKRLEESDLTTKWRWRRSYASSFKNVQRNFIAARFKNS